jgi:glycosyl hydrolase family 123
LRLVNRYAAVVAAVLMASAVTSSAQDTPPADDSLVLWGKRVVVTNIDQQRPDLRLPEWKEPDAILGPPDGAWVQLILHNGWNDHGAITVDLGSEMAWGELVLVHRQRGPGAAKNTTIHVAGEDQDFRKFGNAPISETETTTVLPCDRPVRYVQIIGGAGGAVGLDSTWYFDAVGMRTGRAALARTDALNASAESLKKRLDALGTPESPAQKKLLVEGRARLDAQRTALGVLDKVALEDIPAALLDIKAGLNQLDALVIRLMAAQTLAKFNDGQPPAYVATWMPSMAKVRPADPLRSSDIEAQGRVALARHEYESIQLVLAAGDTDLRDVEVTLEPLVQGESGQVIEAENLVIARLDHVRVNGELWPDPILPLDSLTVPAGSQQALRIQIYAPLDTPAGLYRSVAHIRPSGLHAIALPLEVRVYDFDLPTNAHTMHIISCGGGGVDRVLFPNRTTTGGGPCAGSIAVPKCILRKDGSVAMDFTEYDVVMTQAFEAGLAGFGLPLSAGDGGGYKPNRMSALFYNEATGAEETVSMDPLESEAAKERLTQWLRIFTGHLREKGWFDRCFFYLWDEPNAEYTKTLLAVGRAVKEAVPDLKNLIVESPHKQWHEVADIYCPQVKWFGRDSAKVDAEALRAMGIELWWYNCGDPSPYPTYAISHPAACARMSFLLMWKYELTGNLYWATGCNSVLGDDVLENPGADGRGDGQLVYNAGPKGIVPSMRLEMVRDGVEDYEYLWLLRDRIRAAKKRGVDTASFEGLLELPPEVAVDATHYTHDPDVLEGWRTCVAEAIEALAEPELAQSIDGLWDVTWDRFYLPQTHLFYDYLTSYESGRELAHLPTADEVRRQVPNECGYDTGMEDGMISAGVMLSLIVDQYAVVKDEELRQRARDVFEGIRLCATAHGVPGFLARGVCAEDLKNIYPNSSRDQYTHAVHGLWMYSRSPLCSPETRKEIGTILSAVADRMTRNVTPENNYDSLRADGTRDTRGISRMWNVKGHEAARLPMLYAAAWDVTGKQEYHDLYRKYLKLAVKQSLSVENVQPTYALQQMQASLELLSALERDPDLKREMRQIMATVAERCAGRARSAGARAKKLDLTMLCTDWRTGEGLSSEGRYRTVWYCIRESGEAALTQLMLEEVPFSDEQSQLLAQAITRLDPQRVSSCGIFYLQAAYWKARRRAVSD